MVVLTPPALQMHNVDFALAFSYEHFDNISWPAPRSGMQSWTAGETAYVFGGRSIMHVSEEDNDDIMTPFLADLCALPFIGLFTAFCSASQHGLAFQNPFNTCWPRCRAVRRQRPTHQPATAQSRADEAVVRSPGHPEST